MRSLGSILVSILVVVLIVAGCFLVPFGRAAGKRSNLSSASSDSFGNLCWHEEQKRLDTFASRLQQDPALKAYIVVYAGRKSCPGEAKFRAERAKKWLVNRGIKANRIVWKDGGYRETVETVLQSLDTVNQDSSPTPTLMASDV